MSPVWLSGCGDTGREFSRSEIHKVNSLLAPTCPVVQTALPVGTTASQTPALPGCVALVVHLFILILLLSEILTGKKCPDYHREASRWQRNVVIFRDDIKIIDHTGKGRRQRTSGCMCWLGVSSTSDRCVTMPKIIFGIHWIK